MAEEVDTFIRVFYEKGYRGQFFEVSGFVDVRRGKPVSLREHLAEWWEKQQGDGEAGRAIYVLYEVYSAPHGCNIACRFEIVSGTTAKINISRMKLTMEQGNESHVIRVENNRRAPGSQAVTGYFRRPKPWDDQIRGRFPRR
jgi:hypothetical protein